MNEIVVILARQYDPETWSIIDAQTKRGLPSSPLLRQAKQRSLDYGSSIIVTLAAANYEVTQSWSSDMDAAREAGIVDLWAQERERYEHERIPDCLYHERVWVHEQTIHDDDSIANEAGFVEVFNPTHWRLRPTPPVTGEINYE